MTGVSPVAPEQWRRVRAAVPAAAARLCDMAAGAEPTARATAEWSVADTLAHVAAVTALNVAAVGGDPDLPVSELVRLRRNTTVDTVSVMNRTILDQFTDRRPAALAGRVRCDIATLLVMSEHQDPQWTVPWLGGAALPLAGMFAHLLNELTVHGWDIARSRRVAWPIDPRDAALFVDLFLVGLARCGFGDFLDGSQAAADRITVAFCSGVSPPVTFGLDRGVVTLADETSQPDVRLSYDPAIFILMFFGRISRTRAVLAGKVRVTGRRPWLLPAVLATMRPPR